VRPATICRQSKNGQNPLFFGTTPEFARSSNAQNAIIRIARGANFKMKNFFLEDEIQ
jgi:hypothetical protein